MIEIERLSVTFAAGTALRDATLRVAPGDRIGVVGESGSGKSMLGLAMMGMVPDAATVTGAVRLNGTDLAGAPEEVWRRHRARDVAMVFQEPMAALNPLRRIGDTVAEPLRLHQGLSRARARDKALALFEEVGIPDPAARLRQFPHELSGGQRQRVLIALALACDPAVLIADEPTTALDANVALRIIDLLVDLSDRRRMGLVFISHDLAAVARATARLVVLYGGAVVEEGPTEAVLAAPAHPYTRGLIAARPRGAAGRGPDGRRPRLATIPGTVPPLAALPPGCRFAGRCPVERPECAGTVPPLHHPAPGRAAHCHAIGAAP
ncbi:MAG: ABC transporter ATP-binding protein [Gemmobacter sp.]